MSCSGLNGDYRCAGWITVTERIRDRDRKKCRGCNRNADEIRLEVHHRAYGKPGSCGNCYLTGVLDDDLITLCIDCHDAITDVRRRIRYGSKPVVVTHMPDPIVAIPIVRMSNMVIPDIEKISVNQPVIIRLSPTDRLMKGK